jgi:fused signal recognition particle receptor
MNEGRLEIVPESVAAEERKSSFWGKLKRGLFMTHTEVLDRVEAALQGRAVLDEETLESLEEGLIAADIGVQTALELVEEVRKDVKQHEAVDALRLRERLVDEMALLLMDAPVPPPRQAGPMVTLLVGVNGVGKTTTAAKLAHRALADGEKVLLAAGDTFRAAAVEQLALWATRLGVDIVKQGHGADPAAVVYDALQAARARQLDQVIVDTAGRLHTKDNLMAELAKIKRVIDREAEGWQQRRLLVLDATTGQNAVAQAREFVRTAEVDGIVLAKLDGTAKGGVAVAIARELRLPIVYLGVGEAADDLIDFRPREFAAALLG